MTRAEVEAGYREIQAAFGRRLEELDGRSRFVKEPWERSGGGGGESWTLTGEGPIEKAAVNVSAVWGRMPMSMSERLAAPGREFYATGVSIIVHPLNPHSPTFHANLRYFETDETAWFGGGADLTPYYLFEDDARHFHGVLAEVCHRSLLGDYPGWKTACDRYFFLPHRGEARGVGGIFFDHLTEHADAAFALQMELGTALGRAYPPMVEDRAHVATDPYQKLWHELRRGRYVEFNLVWDRGTKFGLDTGGRTASILASLPPRARWDETFVPEPGSPEEELLDLVRGEPRNWV